MVETLLAEKEAQLSRLRHLQAECDALSAALGASHAVGAQPASPALSAASPGDRELALAQQRSDAAGDELRLLRDRVHALLAERDDALRAAAAAEALRAPAGESDPGLARSAAALEAGEREWQQAALKQARDELFALRRAHDAALGAFQRPRVPALTLPAARLTQQSALLSAATASAAAASPPPPAPFAACLCPPPTLNLARLETVLFELQDVASAGPEAAREALARALAAQAELPRADGPEAGGAAAADARFRALLAQLRVQGLRLATAAGPTPRRPSAAELLQPAAAAPRQPRPPPRPSSPPLTLREAAEALRRPASAGTAARPPWRAVAPSRLDQPHSRSGLRPASPRRREWDGGRVGRATM